MRLRIECSQARLRGFNSIGTIIFHSCVSFAFLTIYQRRVRQIKFFVLFRFLLYPTITNDVLFRTSFFLNTAGFNFFPVRRIFFCQKVLLYFLVEHCFCQKFILPIKKFGFVIVNSNNLNGRNGLLKGML